MQQRGGRLLAISMDEMEDSKRLIADEQLTFPILSALGIPVLDDYGLAHPGGGQHGETIAVPALLLIGQDGAVLWKHVAERITDRAAPEQVLAVLARTIGAPTAERRSGSSPK